MARVPIQALSFNLLIILKKTTILRLFASFGKPGRALFRVRKGYTLAVPR